MWWSLALLICCHSQEKHCYRSDEAAWQAPRLALRVLLAFTDMLAGAEYLSPRITRYEDICALQYTGGTTGVSKGVMLTQGTLMSNVAQTLACDQSRMSRSVNHFTTVAPLPLYHIYAWISDDGLMPATQRAQCINSRPAQYSACLSVPSKSLNLKYFCGLNSLFVALLQRQKTLRLDFLQPTINPVGRHGANGFCSTGLAAATGCVVSEGYGMTESSPVISMNPPGHEKIGYAGIPIAGTEIKVVNEKGLSKDVGGIGELCVRGDQVMAGYWRSRRADRRSDCRWLVAHRRYSYSR